MKKKQHEKSFTLIETIVALGLISSFLIQVILIQGRSVEFSDYNRRVTQAGWLAKAVMAQVERAATLYPFPDLKLNVREERFTDDICTQDPIVGCDYTYSASIEEFKLPIIEMIAQAVLGDQKGNAAGSPGDVIQSQIKNYLGDEQFRMAKVSVHWPSGSRQENYDLVYLIPNQMKMDESALSLKGKKKESSGKGAKTKSKGGREGANTSSSPTTDGASSQQGTSRGNRASTER